MQCRVGKAPRKTARCPLAWPDATLQRGRRAGGRDCSLWSPPAEPSPGGIPLTILIWKGRESFVKADRASLGGSCRPDGSNG